jgi:hypothetical protein
VGSPQQRPGSPYFIRERRGSVSSVASDGTDHHDEGKRFPNAPLVLGGMGSAMGDMGKMNLG